MAELFAKYLQPLQTLDCAGGQDAAYSKFVDFLHRRIRWKKKCRSRLPPTNWIKTVETDNWDGMSSTVNLPPPPRSWLLHLGGGLLDIST
jgi:hypothetical protein